jgi:DNA-directed RNA polymerase specialized sigma24 family protein
LKEEKPQKKGAWVPSKEAWDKFLALLDADDQVAGERYEGIRKRLVIFFEGRNCRGAEDLADKAIVRVIKKVHAGEEIDNVMRYSFGVAKIIRREEGEIVRRENLIQQELLRSGADFVSPDDFDDESELRFVAFEHCLELLPPAKRTFILNYYEDTGRDKIDNRKSLSEKLGISQNAVTLRAYQIRKKLEKCIKNRLRSLKQVRKESH